MYQRILVPVDGSKTSDHGLDEAIRLARLTRARLRLLHVVDDMSMAVALDGRVTASMDWLGMLREGGAALLEKAARHVREAGIAVDTVLIDNFRQGLPETVADEATTWPADVVVLGTHGRRGIDRLLLGSDAEQILRSAPVPVLLVRPPNVAAQQAA